MSRSRPHENSTPNPSQRWFEWNGEAGTIRYYDKEEKQNIDVPLPFQFVLLDRLGTVGGWHEPSKSAIYANEVRDTRQDVMVVKAFKQGVLAEGVYSQIRDRVNAVGGQFVANCYIAFKLDGALAIGSLKLKGAALGGWMEFEKAHKADLFTQAIKITGFTEGKKGRITFCVPTFETAPLSAQSNGEAVALDAAVQAYLDGYMQRTTSDRVDHADTVTRQAGPVDPDEPPPPTDEEFEGLPPSVYPDDEPAITEEDIAW